MGNYIYIYAFSRRFYPKRLTVQYLGYNFFCQYVCSLEIEPTTFALLTQCSTTEPQEHDNNYDKQNYVVGVVLVQHLTNRKSQSDTTYASSVCVIASLIIMG